jgi:hypothetical protein
VNEVETRGARLPQGLFLPRQLVETEDELTPASNAQHAVGVNVDS